MKNTLSFWQLMGFVFTAIAGILLHFAYNWSNQSLFIAPLAAINESIWEHMKLLFVPMFIFSLIENQFLGQVFPNFWNVKLIGILTAILLIPLLYYSYTGIFGIQLDWVNIAIFFVAVAIAYVLETYLFKSNALTSMYPLLSLLILCLLAFLFVVFTFLPPNIPLFANPSN